MDTLREQLLQQLWDRGDAPWKVWGNTCESLLRSGYIGTCYGPGATKAGHEVVGLDSGLFEGGLLLGRRVAIVDSHGHS